jgi:nucleotide-binding universal stress UspA family protein
MHVLIATDGTLDIDKAAQFATALAGSEGKTTVATIVRIPRRLVEELRSKWGAQASTTFDADAEYVGAPQIDVGGAAMPRSWPGDDAVIDQYLGNKRVEIARPVVLAIREDGGDAESIVREGDDVEDEIMELRKELDADVIVIGSHGHGAFQGLLGSTGAKLVRRAAVPVLVIR